MSADRPATYDELYQEPPKQRIPVKPLTPVEQSAYEHFEATGEDLRPSKRNTDSVEYRRDEWKRTQAAEQERENAERRAVAFERFERSVLTTEQIADLPPPEWLVDGWLVRDSLAMLYGPSGASKTFLLVDWALHVAVGQWWNGQAVHTGRVLYVIAEGVHGIGLRIEAWKRHHRVHQLGRYNPIDWQPRAVNLTDEDELGGLVLYAHATKPDLIVVDTLARNSVGAEENSAKDMGVVVAGLDKVRAATGACVVVAHHSGKDGAAGARGSSSLRGAMDTELELTAVDHRLTLRCTKQKDAAETHPLRLDRVPVDGTDSCVLTLAGPASMSDDLTAGAAATLDALARIELPSGVPSGQWQESADCSRRSFFTHRKLLLDRGLVDNVGTDRQPRYVTTPDTPADGSHD